MFFDRAKIYVKGGDGGNGMVAYRREKYVPDGGPWGGDGGNGGSVILKVDEGLRTLVDFRFKKHFKADKGESGKSKNMHGANGKDLTLQVPMGSIVKDAETGEVLADLVEKDQEFVIAKGGRGGRGNSRFASNTNKAPGFAENGDLGEERWIRLELKLIADVGLIGYPNVGKSTLISVVSAAKPKIANYHFTTVVPNLGVVRLSEGHSFVLADIPGLIEGAHTGQGLGHEFLRHVERTKMLIHVLDISGSEGRDPIEDFQRINHELEAYNKKLAGRLQIVAANKMDVPGAEENLKRLEEFLGPDIEVFPISAVTNQGTETLMYRVAEILPKIEDDPIVEQVEKFTVVEDKPRFEISKDDDVFVVSGEEIEKHFIRTDFNNEESVNRFAQILKLMGVDDALRKQGVQEGDSVRIMDLEFDFID